MERYLTDGSQIFNVPNNEEGWAFIKSCHKFLHTRRQRLDKRGRGKRDGTFSGRASISPKKAEWIAVYNYRKRTEAEEKRAYELEQEKRQMDMNLVNRIRELEEKLKAVKELVV